MTAEAIPDREALLRQGARMWVTIAGHAEEIAVAVAKDGATSEDRIAIEQWGLLVCRCRSRAADLHSQAEAAAKAKGGR